MKNQYFPVHEKNRMKNEGNVAAAREYFLAGKNRVLYHLIKQRFSWMNRYINPSDKDVMELGSGAGLSKMFIRNENLCLTDVIENEWIDCYQDASNISVEDESQDVIICSHMLHHIANPAGFLEHVSRKLKPGGKLLVQDIYTGSLMKLVLRIMRHEGWSDFVDVYDREAICNDPSDPWSANCSIPKLLFFDSRFQKEFPMYKLIKRRRNECLLFLLSGGVIAKTYHAPLGNRGAHMLQKIDKLFVQIAPGFFSCGCSVVLQKKAVNNIQE